MLKQTNDFLRFMVLFETIETPLELFSIASIEVFFYHWHNNNV